METKRSKYDTNPLDPDFVKNTEEVWGEGGSGSDTKEVKGATREIGSSGNENARSNIYSEAPTRRYDNVPSESPYPSVFVPPTYSPPAPYQPPPAPYRHLDQKLSTRSVPGIGLPEKWAAMLPYCPWYIGIVPALLVLFLVPRSEVKVRFHAAQALALQVAILVIHTLFSVVGLITGNTVGGSLFKVAAIVFLIISMVRVWKGEPHHLAPLAEPTEWFNEHIEPRNKS
ncbi:MAG TPA: hypothetical protein DHU55_10590 [Blastocatellia bacterium]|jgi:uncharacterized membrane protein|nr:hypothetical protein [Blastocatellia bacterium]HAF23755.1 hypothetical protein [Blastocatellia bacterium]HCX30200.1 hypothetical protein [Blastocatellia bacterium]